MSVSTFTMNWIIKNSPIQFREPSNIEINNIKRNINIIKINIPIHQVMVHMIQ